ncbi:MAG: phosphatidylglycerophosphatase A [Synergistaceae bacterium]|nr:phosphatidylglycerophosphatase A [Synergistaceae bacterium]
MANHSFPVLIATLGGVGFYSSMPGTLGSGAACLVSAGVPVPWQAILAVSGVGIWAAGVAERELGKTDPGCVVIDEAVGMWLSVLWLPRSFLIPGFLLFRLVDILKPFPVSAMERLPGGWGIMADDVMGGLMVNVLLQAVNALFFHAGWLYPLLSRFVG